MTNEEFVTGKDFRGALWLLMRTLERVDYLLDEPADEFSDLLNSEAMRGWEEAYCLMHDMIRDTFAPYAVGLLLEEWKNETGKEDAE